MAEEQQTGSEQDDQPERLSVLTTVTDGITVVTPAGEVDNDTGGRLRQALDITGTVRPRLVIDMGQVTFMDSVGINILISTYQNVTAADGWLRLAAPTAPVRRILQLVGIDKLIDCHPTLSHALES
ncbi:STAS domain-containing protein [Streptomyces sp. NPDC048188]|uniref:STAS domain-containing protein n=1 Tax=Streptomyces sp. NPDC048188 TaxID=3155749 RepID=UPI0034419FAA